MHARRRIVILGAAGRDFHNFNVVYRDDSSVEVVAFTATQIPGIESRTYPPQLSGPLYPNGIPIVGESELEKLIAEQKIDACIFSYSDVSHEHVMRTAARVLAAGSSFELLSARSTMLRSRLPVIAVTAVRTGSGKSQTTRYISGILKRLGVRAVVVRHPMPYGDLAHQTCQRFAMIDDLTRHHCTIEEREEYEPHLDNGFVVYAGVDYAKILQRAEKEADVILWDGGNNDLPFYEPTLHICIADPHRAGDELSYFPGDVNFRMADLIVINKCDTADPHHIVQIEERARELNPVARVLRADSPVTVDEPISIRGRRALVVEDGPTLTHGGMSYGAGMIAAKAHRASEIVDPTHYAVGSIRETYAKYPNAHGILPAMGYGEKQLAELEETIRRTPADVVVVGTPIDLRRVLRLNKDAVRVRYDLRERESGVLESWCAKAIGMEVVTKHELTT